MNIYILILPVLLSVILFVQANDDSWVDLLILCKLVRGFIIVYIWFYVFRELVY